MPFSPKGNGREENGLEGGTTQGYNSEGDRGSRQSRTRCRERGQQECTVDSIGRSEAETRTDISEKKGAGPG